MNQKANIGDKPATPFGELLKAKRIAAGYGLRQFAEMVGELPSNYCNVEKGRRGPPNATKLRKILDTLEVENGSREWVEFINAFLETTP